MTLEAQLAEIIQRLARIERQLGIEEPSAETEALPESAAPCEPETSSQALMSGWVEPHVAASRLGFTQDYVRKLAGRGAGKKFAGRWLVDLDRLRDARSRV